MTLFEARYLADSIIAKLVPVTDRAMVCGSIRRKRPECHDVDLVVIPKRNPIEDMFSNVTGYEPVPEFISIVNAWTKIKGEPTGRYTQRLLANGTKLEISMCTQDNWGNITLIRTGDHEFAHKLMTRALRLGFEQKDGYLWKDDTRLSVPTEERYFELLNLPYVAPEDRNEFTFRKNVPAR